MKTKSLFILIALAFLVLSCAVTAKPSSQGNGLPPLSPAFLTDYSEDPYAIPVSTDGASAIEDGIERPQQSLPSSCGPMLSAVEPSAIEDVVERFQHGLPGSSGPLLSAVEPSALEDAIRKFRHDSPDSYGPLLSAVDPSAMRTR